LRPSGLITKIFERKGSDATGYRAWGNHLAFALLTRRKDEMRQ
jgi:hypothetical protein